MRLQQWGLQGSVEQVSAPLHLQATVGMLTPGLSATQVGWRRLLPRIQKATLRIPTLRGQLAGPNQPPRPFQIHDLLLQAAGQWGPEGFDSTLERLQAQIAVTGWPRAEVRMAGRLTPQRLDLASLHVRLPQSEIHASGALTLPHWHVQLRLDMPRLRLDELGFSPPAHCRRWYRAFLRYTAVCRHHKSQPICNMPRRSSTLPDSPTGGASAAIQCHAPPGPSQYGARAGR